MKHSDSLSDRRGNALGIRIFLLLLRIMGVNRTCELVWLVTFFYVCFELKSFCDLFSFFFYFISYF